MTLRLALCQVDATVGDVEGNADTVRSWLVRARAAGADIVAFPELVLTGYPPEDLLLRPDFVAASRAALEGLAGGTRGLTAVVGFVDADGDLFNAAAVLHDGSLAGVYRKQFLPNYGVFDEFRYFSSGETTPVWRIGDVVLGVNICEDIWYPNGPTLAQSAIGQATVVINISASPYHAGKGQTRAKMIATRAQDSGCWVAFVNLVGGQDELIFDGHSLVAAPDGQIIACGAQFAEELLVVDIDPALALRERHKEPERGVLSMEGLECGEVVVGELAALERGDRPALAPPSCPAPLDPASEVYAALVLGVRDYVAKTGFRMVGVALSGGIDSALTAAVAVDALGADRVVGVTMPSEFTAELSTEDAETLAAALGIRIVQLPIADLRSVYETALAGQFAGTEPGVAEENVQARIRGSLIMALANKFGWLVLATGNKSELSVGYATLYGDMAGGFAVLKDVLKTKVYELARWRNGWRGPAPAPALALLGPDGPVIPERTIERPPSAELKPGQLDTDSLPPYEVLDPILMAYVEEDRSVDEIVAAGHDAATVKRVARMVEAAEYKRRQGPVGIKITTRAFGKDRRMPIANGYRG